VSLRAPGGEDEEDEDEDKEAGLAPLSYLSSSLFLSPLGVVGCKFAVACLW